MKKYFLLLIFLLPLLIGATPTKPTTLSALVSSSETVNLTIRSEAAMLVEPTSGTIIFAKNEDQKLYPASMTKMMGMLLLLEHIAAGRMSFDDIISVSANAASMGGTQVFLQPGEKMSVYDLFKAVAINSANDAIVALGEAHSGTEEEFVANMNKRAKVMGLTNTNFVNPTGFHDPSHYSSARDMATIARELLKFDQQVLQFTSQFDAYIREDSASPFWLVNTNKLVKYYEGMDGLKTGFTSDSLYCLTATAKRDHLRLLTVVMRANSIDDRSRDTTLMMDYGFAHYQSRSLYQKGQALAKYDFKNARDQQTPLITTSEVRIVLKKGEKFDGLTQEIELLNTEAPVKAGTVVARLKVVNQTGWVYYFDLMVALDVPKANWWDFFIKAFGHVFAALK